MKINLTAFSLSGVIEASGRVFLMTQSLRQLKAVLADKEKFHDLKYDIETMREFICKFGDLEIGIDVSSEPIAVQIAQGGASDTQAQPRTDQP